MVIFVVCVLFLDFTDIDKVVEQYEVAVQTLNAAQGSLDYVARDQVIRNSNGPEINFNVVYVYRL